MNLAGLYDTLFLRDFLAFLVPGAVGLYGILVLLRAVLGDQWKQIIFSLGEPLPGVVMAAALVAAFLLGHVLDFLYRRVFQNSSSYKQPDAIRERLRWEEVTGASAVDPRSNRIRMAVEAFCHIHLEESGSDARVRAGRGLEVLFALRNWIQLRNQRIFSSEIARPSLQAHMLYSTALALWFLAACRVVAAIIEGLSSFPCTCADVLRAVLFSAVLAGVGYLFMLQGGHKRRIMVENTFRVFAILWEHAREGCIDAAETLQNANRGSGSGSA